MPYTVRSGDTLWSIWQRSGGDMSWSDFKRLNAHLGNLDLIHPGDSIKLPGDAAPSGTAAPAPAPSPAPASGVPEGPSVPMNIEPGAYLEILEERMELERQWRAEQAEIARVQAENTARGLELQLASSPIDFVAYELYKREREAAGLPTYSGAPSSDADIQAMLAEFHGGGARGTGGGTPSVGPSTDPRGPVLFRHPMMASQSEDVLGIGEFGAAIPRTEAISRAEMGEISPQEMDILSSFLKAGFEANGQQVSYNPEDYWREVEQGFVPTIQTGRTRYAF